jgi:predicted SprT family Zn-dependent metalloprotease
MARGEPPRKRLTKEKYHYTCKKCGQDKNKKTGHTQLKGRWYCPESGQTLDDWRKSVGL